MECRLCLGLLLWVYVKLLVERVDAVVVLVSLFVAGSVPMVFLTFGL